MTKRLETPAVDIPGIGRLVLLPGDQPVVVEEASDMIAGVIYARFAAGQGHGTLAALITAQRLLPPTCTLYDGDRIVGTFSPPNPNLGQVDINFVVAQ